MMIFTVKRFSSLDVKDPGKENDVELAFSIR